jgi:hypothetical protein
MLFTSILVSFLFSYFFWSKNYDHLLCSIHVWAPICRNLSLRMVRMAELRFNDRNSIGFWFNLDLFTLVSHTFTAAHAFRNVSSRFSRLPFSGLTSFVSLFAFWLVLKLVNQHLRHFGWSNTLGNPRNKWINTHLKMHNLPLLPTSLDCLSWIALLSTSCSFGFLPAHVTCVSGSLPCLFEDAAT